MRNWLIRTTNNTILGPIPEKKLKILIKKGSLEANDEICSGNGYWISIKEVSLVKKYLYEGIQQGFDPIYHVNAKDDLILEEEKASKKEELELELNLEVFSKDSETNLDLGSSSQVNLEDHIDIEKKPRLQVKQTPSDLSHLSKVFTGNILKIVVVLCIIIALVLIYFRNTLLDSIFT